MSAHPRVGVGVFFAAENKHYVTLFVLAQSPSGEPRVLEPEKCAGWTWRDWCEFPAPLFAPLQTLRDQGYAPALSGSAQSRSR